MILIALRYTVVHLLIWSPCPHPTLIGPSMACFDLPWEWLSIKDKRFYPMFCGVSALNPNQVSALSRHKDTENPTAIQDSAQICLLPESLLEQKLAYFDKISSSLDWLFTVSPPLQCGNRSCTPPCLVSHGKESAKVRPKPQKLVLLPLNFKTPPTFCLLSHFIAICIFWLIFTVP